MHLLSRLDGSILVFLFPAVRNFAFSARLSTPGVPASEKSCNILPYNDLRQMTYAPRANPCCQLDRVLARECAVTCFKTRGYDLPCRLGGRSQRRRRTRRQARPESNTGGPLATELSVHPLADGSLPRRRSRANLFQCRVSQSPISRARSWQSIAWRSSCAR